MMNLSISTNLLIILSIVIFVLIVACIVYIIYKDKKQDREEINDLIDDLVKAKPRKRKKDELITTKIEVPIGGVEKVEDNQKIDLESMLSKMQKSLDMKQEEVVTSFENEQEEKAIISYQELVQNMKEETFQQDIQINEKAQEDIYESTREQVKEFLMKEEPKIRKIESPTEERSKKFKNTDFISPIFGKINANIEYPTIKLFEKPKTDIEEYFEEDIKPTRIDYGQDNFENNTIIQESIDVVPLKEEMKKNDDFLKALKEFRGNL